MPELPVVPDSSEEAKTRAFQYKLDLLKAEIEIIDRAIARLDEITQATKNWAIVIWSATIATAIGQTATGSTGWKPVILITAAVPILFWITDARWRYFLRGFIYRQDKIADFLNTEKLSESFVRKEFVGLSLLDPRGLQYRKTQDYKQIVNFWRAMRYPEVSWVYIGMTAVSLGLGVFFLLNS